MNEILIYQSEDGKTKLDIKLENETLWLTQKEMADLFQVTVPTVNEHIKNIFLDGELEEERTIRNFLIVRQEGQRKVQRNIEHYNLDMIISIKRVKWKKILKRQLLGWRKSNGYNQTRL